MYVFSTHFSIFIIFSHLFYQKVIQDTLLIQTPHYHGQFALPLGKESPLTFSLNSSRLIRTLSMVPSVLVLTGFDCNKIHQCFNRMMESIETKVASHAGLFRRARFSSLPTNACSTENNIPFPLFYLRGK